MSGYRAALRVARREALRSKGRSALVVAMIGVPMLALAFADVAARTGQVSLAETARREIGAADLVAELVSGEPVRQQGLWGFGADRGPTPPPEKDPDLARLLPPGSRVHPWHTSYAVVFRARDRAVTGELERLDTGADVADGLVALREGAHPRAADEAAVTPRTARDLRIGVGDVVTVAGDHDFRVTGILVARSSLSAQKVYVPPSARLPRSLGVTTGSGRRWAVTLPPGASDVALVPPLNEAGMRVMPRTWFVDPPEDPYARVDAEAVGVTVVAVGLATLEIVLLAGTAFAVGARRKRRELALVAATGGDRRDVRRIVLAEGVVLGAVAGVLGVAGGIAAVFFGRPLLERVTGSLMGPLDLRPLELGGIVAVGAGTALLASLLPARAASRQPVVSALTGRRGATRTPKRVPAIALAAVVCGAALAFWAAGTGRPNVPGETYADAGRRANFTLVLVGAVIAELGFVACAPALVGLVGRAATRLPLALRLAARDAARHRTRSGPAVGAVVAAVAGSVALSVYVASDTDRQRREYQPQHPRGVAALGFGDLSDPVPREDLDEAVRRLPVRDRIEVGDVHAVCFMQRDCLFWAVETPPEFRCEPEDPDSPPCRLADVPRPASMAVADPRFVSLWTGRDDPDVTRAMAGGAVAVFDGRWLQGGAVVLRGEVRSQQGELLRVERRTVPAVVAPPPAEDYTMTPSAVIPPATAKALRVPVSSSRLYVTTTRPLAGGDEAAARGALTRNRPWADFYVERGFRRESGAVLLALLAAAAFVTMAATGIATGLAAADSRPDLATLAAVGAAPRVRRVLGMAQAATVAALGTGLGILAGLVPSLAIVAARAEFHLALPWSSLAAIAAGVPLLAAALVGLVTRSRLPLERRIA